MTTELKKKTRLTNLKVTEGSLVDKGANQEAEVVLFKREGILEKVGRKISGGRMKVLKELMAAFEDVTQKLGTMFADIETGTQKGAHMPIDEKVLNDLPDEVKQHIEDLEKSKTESDEKFSAKETELEESVTKGKELEVKVEELEKSEKTDEDKKKEILKGASDEVIAKMDELQKQVDSANEIAKAEKEARITKEYEDKAKDLPNVVGSVEEIAKQLRVADEGGIGEQVHKQLKAMNEQAKTILKESGSAGTGGVGGDADAKIEAGGAVIAKAENISKEQGVAKFMETDEGKALYSQAGGLN